MSDFDLSKITGTEPPLMTDDDKDAEIERLRAEIVKAVVAEREACAAECDRLAQFNFPAKQCATAIRARSET